MFGLYIGGMKIIIYGANETGSIIATEFFEDHDIIVIDSDSSRLEKFNNLDLATIVGEASNINVLKEAGIKDADVFIACTCLDEANIVACLMAKQLSNAQTACFVSKKECRNSLSIVKESMQKDGALHIDYVIWPEKLLVSEIFRIVTVPDAINVEDFSLGRAKLLEYRIKENSMLLDKCLKDVLFNEETLVVGIKRDDELFIPKGDDKFQLNDKAIFMGTAEGLDITASQFFVEEKNPLKSVAIIGGGTVGFELAKSLEKTPIKTKLIEKDYKRCEFLSEQLKKTLILNSDGTNLELLNEERIGECDVTISVTDSDEKNLLCSLLVKQLGVNRVITRVGQMATASLFEHVGVDVAVSAKKAALNEIKNRIVDYKEGLLATVEMGLAEILEINMPNSFQDVALMKLVLPKRAVVAIVQRGTRVIIPKGQTLIRANDKLIIFTKTEDAEIIRNYFNKLV